jgi:hypothetical protein
MKREEKARRQDYLIMETRGRTDGVEQEGYTVEHALKKILVGIFVSSIMFLFY